jgi:hypothetical protein
MLPKDFRSWMEFSKTGVSLLTALIPMLDNWLTILPTNPQIRHQCLPIAICVCLLAVTAGFSTGRHTGSGLSVGWWFLVLFLVILSIQLATLPHLVWAERPLYVLLFAFFSLSASSFLAYSARRQAIFGASWNEDSSK